MTCGIYVIHCNGRPYVGRSIDIEDRWKHHLALLKRGAHQNGILQNTFNKYGKDVFSLLILEECPRNRLPEREHSWCLQLNSYHEGCNLAAVVQNDHYIHHHTAKSKAHLSQAMRKRRDNKRKLSAGKVLDIWLRYMDGEACTSIADNYGVNSKSVWYIVSRRYYREIELPPLCRRKERRRPGGGRKKNAKSSLAAELFREAGISIPSG